MVYIAAALRYSYCSIHCDLDIIKKNYIIRLILLKKVGHLSFANRIASMYIKCSIINLRIPSTIYLFSSISLTASMLFNNSLSEGIFPEYFKTAKIIPIFKTGDSNSTVNYRPISILPFLSKIFEKLMCARLDSYLKSNNILCTNQFGFRKNSNTSEAIIEFLDYASSSLDSKQSNIAVYLEKHSTQLIITY